MKKFFSALLVAAALMVPVAMTGCGGGEDATGTEAPAEGGDTAAEEGSTE